MATVTNGSAGPGQSVAADPLAVGGWRDGDESDSKSDRYLAKRLAAAGADYKGVALTTFLLGVGVAVLVWLAVGIILEHWVVPGGLSRPVRWAWLVTGLAAVVAAIIRWVVPLVRYRVNLVYAARAIERDHPELHNDLVNTVLVRSGFPTCRRRGSSTARRPCGWPACWPRSSASPACMRCLRRRVSS
jgi:hypothetical protein